MTSIKGEKNLKTGDYGHGLISWEVPEYDKHDRAKSWYIKAGLIALLLVIYSFLTANFLFAIIVIIVSLVVVLHDGQEPERVVFSISDDGIIIGSRFYDYDDISNFSVVYKPSLEVKNLYFEFKSFFRHRLSIPLENMNPLPIREKLLKYLPEDLERTDQPLSEGLAKLFKL